MGKRSEKTAAEVIAEAEAMANGTPGIMRSSTDWVPERELEMIVRQFYARKGVMLGSNSVTFGQGDDGMIYAEVTAERQPFAFKTRQRRSKTAE